jgi:hypothetical protein
MSGKKTNGSKPAKSASSVEDTFRLSLADIEALTRHPQIKIANRRLRKAFEAITGWRMIGTRGIPRKKFELAVEYEDALGDVKEAFITATRDWLHRSECPVCGSGPKQRRLGRR